MELPSVAGGAVPYSARGDAAKPEDGGRLLAGAGAKQTRVGQLDDERHEPLRPRSRAAKLELERLDVDVHTVGLAQRRSEDVGPVFPAGAPQFMFQTAARRKLEEMKGSHERLQGALRQREAESASLRQALEAARRESQELEASLREQLLEARSLCARQSAELEELRGRLSQAEQHADSLLGGLKAEVETLRGEVDGLRRKGETLQDENDVLKREHADLEAERRALGDMLEEALRLKDAQASRLDAAVEEARGAAEAHRAELGRRAAELEAARGLAAELDLKVKRLEAAAASSQLDALKGKEAALREQKDQIELDYVMLHRESESGSEQPAAAQQNTLQREVELLRGQLLSQTYEAFQSRRKAEEDKQQLLVAKLADAINQRVQLHICVPRTSVTYNNAPPFVANVADGLSPERIGHFLEREVFPHFEPLWARLDAMELGPDDSSKKAYSKKMLGRLTDAVQAYIRRAQSSPAAASQVDGDGPLMGRTATC